MSQSMIQSVVLIVLISSAVLLVLSTIFAAGAWREARRISRQQHARLETELDRTRQALSEAKGQVRQLEERLEEERPEKVQWELRHATEELKRLERAHSEAQRQLGENKQQWLHLSEQQEQQIVYLEQERRNLMEELERWRGRYAKAEQQVEQLAQKRSQDQQRIEHLTQLRQRLLEEMRDIGEE